MQFKHPEILYALLLLLIPILVHLFQLRRFKKVPFTNVAFLKQVDQQTRKSRNLKKWLILLTRMLLLACIIVAFAQPYLSKQKSVNVTNELVVYLDNSFSMQARGQKGELYLHAIQELISSMDEASRLTVFTNDKTFRNVTIKTLKNDLIATSYSGKQLDYNAALLKGKQYFTNNTQALKQLVLISDFQQHIDLPTKIDSTNINVHLVQLTPENNINSSLYSAYIGNSTNNSFELSVKVQTTSTNEVPVSLYLDDVLSAKSVTDASNNVYFTIPNNTALKGSLQLEDGSVAFDNKLFFSINEVPKIKVLSINNAPDEFLQRIYTSDEFDYTGSTLSQLNFNTINEQNLIVLNELETISVALQNALVSFVNEGNYLLIIPSDKINKIAYNQLVNQIELTPYGEEINQDNQITTINFDHPLYSEVFNKRVVNFQFPKVTSFYATNTNNALLSFQDKRPFLQQSGTTYAFYSAIKLQNSNFINSPLIVPTLYNIAKESFKIPKLYYTIGEKNAFEVPIALNQDEIIELRNSEAAFIPQQRSQNDKVLITTEELPELAGTYQLTNRDNNIGQVSFNYQRNEGLLNYHNLDGLDDFKVSKNIAETLLNIKNEVDSKPLWKWFVIFALLFLIIEMLILRFFK